MPYPGGKSGAGIYQRLINQIPPHRTYIELFAGNAAIAKYKRPADLTFLIEKDYEQLERLVDSFRSASWTVTESYVDSTSLTLQTNDRSVKLNAIADDAMHFLKAFRAGLQFHHLMTEETFIYVDPPYLGETLKSRSRYRHTFQTRKEHSALLETLITLPCRVAISGYYSALYSEKLSGWRELCYSAMTRGGSAMESLWMNYSEPTQLHDYRFLGENKMQRQSFKRTRERWIRKLGSMSTLRRYAMFAAIDQFMNEVQNDNR